MNNAVYYLIFNTLVGKKENGDYYLYGENGWVRDTESVISDHLIGYDPSEPSGSPYGIGNGSIMADIEEIPYDQAMEKIGGKP